MPGYPRLAFESARTQSISHIRLAAVTADCLEFGGEGSKRAVRELNAQVDS